MKRLLSVSLLALFVAVVAIVAVEAQSTSGGKIRADRSTSASDPDAAGEIEFMATGAGYHAITPQAGVFWHPSSTASGSYTLEGNFALMEPSGHNNYYGLVFGGSNLDNAQQTYVYFLVAQDGTWLIKHRAGDADVHDVAEKAASDAIKTPDTTGQSLNALEVRVGAASIDYVINGTVVHTTPKTGMTSVTDGTYGFRINHRLNVMVDGLEIS